MNRIKGHVTLNQCSKNQEGSIEWMVYNTGEGVFWHNREMTPDGLYAPRIFPNKYQTKDTLIDKSKRMEFLKVLVGFLNPTNSELEQREANIEKGKTTDTMSQLYDLFSKRFQRVWPRDFPKEIKPYHIQGGSARCAYSSLQVIVSQSFEGDRALYLKFKNFNSQKLIKDLRDIVKTESKGVTYEHPLARYGMTKLSFFGLLGALIAFFTGEKVLFNLSNAKLRTILDKAEKTLGEREEKLRLLLDHVRKKEKAILEVDAIAQKDLMVSGMEVPATDLKERKVS